MQTTNTKYTVRYTATKNDTRHSSSIDVFAESKPEAREAALNALRADGETHIVLNSAIQN